jgi:hypothetical protein
MTTSFENKKRLIAKYDLIHYIDDGVPLVGIAYDSDGGLCCVRETAQDTLVAVKITMKQAVEMLGKMNVLEQRKNLSSTNEFVALRKFYRQLQKALP